MAGLIIEGCATFVEYLGALNFIGHKLNKKNIREGALHIRKCPFGVCKDGWI